METIDLIQRPFEIRTRSIISLQTLDIFECTETKNRQIKEGSHKPTKNQIIILQYLIINMC